jgi:predicted metal-dependent enzyme (double-stranded beta helix superfamily)
VAGRARPDVPSQCAVRPLRKRRLASGLGGRCTLGSLAGEIIKTGLDVRTELANAFEQWKDVFRDGLERMQGLGGLSAEADPARLAHLLLSAFQGGMLLAQTFVVPRAAQL